MSVITPYSGAAYQRGHGLGNLFRGLFRVALPVFKSKLGRKIVSTGVGLAGDAFRGRNMKEAVKRRVTDAVLSSVVDGLSPNKKPRKRKQSVKRAGESAAGRAAKTRKRVRKGAPTSSRGRDVFD